MRSLDRVLCAAQTKHAAQRRLGGGRRRTRGGCPGDRRDRGLSGRRSNGRSDGRRAGQPRNAAATTRRNGGSRGRGNKRRSRHCDVVVERGKRIRNRKGGISYGARAEPRSQSASRLATRYGPPRLDQAGQLRHATHSGYGRLGNSA